MEKLAKVFEVTISEFFKSNVINEELNLPLLEKIKLIDTLGKEEQQALFKMIDLALANKRMKDNLQSLLASRIKDKTRRETGFYFTIQRQILFWS